MFLHQIETNGTIHEFASPVPALNCVTIQDVSELYRIPTRIGESAHMIPKELKMSCRLYKYDGLGDPVASMTLEFEETTEIRSPLSLVVMAGKSIIWRMRKC